MMDRERILTTGAGGMVGSYVNCGIRTDAKELNILDREQTLRFIRAHTPLAIIHLAAATDLDRAEKEPAYAYDVNVRGTYNVAMAAREVRAKFVYVSTSGIFNGKKKTPYAVSDAPDPLNEYARSKYIAELVVRSLLPDALVVRGCWMFGGGPKKDIRFVGAIIRQLESGTIDALNDVKGSPTYAKDFIAGVLKLIDGNKKGIYHVANTGNCTRFDIAKQIAAILKPSVAVRIVNGDHFNLRAVRPKNEAMISDVRLRPWKDALTEYLNTEWRPRLVAKKLI